MPRSTALSGVERPTVAAVQFSDQVANVLSGDLYVANPHGGILASTPLMLARKAIEIGDFESAGGLGFYFKYLEETRTNTGLGVSLKVERHGDTFFPVLLALDELIARAEVQLSGIPGQYQHIRLCGNRIPIDYPTEQREAKLEITRLFESLAGIASIGEVLDAHESAKLKAE